MATGKAAVILVTAGKLALFGGLIVRGHPGLIAGYRPGVLPPDAETAVASRTGGALLSLAGLTVGLAILELHGKTSTVIWSVYVTVVVAVAAGISLWLQRPGTAETRD